MGTIFSSTKSGGEHWTSIADMMSGLMMIFLFIAVSYMINVIQDKARIEEIAITYDRLQNDLYRDLRTEFAKDLPRWNAIIDRQSLAVRFQEPSVLFQRGESEVTDAFKDILSDFFPRYIRILTSPKYRNDVEEIRIEGHTSSEWRFDVAEDMAYLYNMKLSQDRTRSVLDYVIHLDDRTVGTEFDWLKKTLTANGLSSSKLIRSNGRENRQASRRVEFRVRTNAEKRIVQIMTSATQ